MTPHTYESAPEWRYGCAKKLREFTGRDGRVIGSERCARAEDDKVHTKGKE